VGGQENEERIGVEEIILKISTTGRSSYHHYLWFIPSSTSSLFQELAAIFWVLFQRFGD